MNNRMIRRIRTVAVAAASVVALIGVAGPASAATSSYNVNMTSGRISVGTTNFDTPGASPVVCVGTTGLSGTIDDTAGTINGTLNINSSEFTAPFTSGNFKLTATGTSNTGTYNAGTNSFSGITYNPISFTIQRINTTGCVVGATVCSGTATLTAAGALASGVTLPLVTGNDVIVNSTAGSIITTSGCGFPWSSVVKPGAMLALGANPAITPAPGGAVFTQV